MHETKKLDTSAELRVPTEHIDTVCTILQQIAKALNEGRSVLIGIDAGDNLRLHCFTNHADMRAVSLIEALSAKTLEVVLDDVGRTHSAPGAVQ